MRIAIFIPIIGGQGGVERVLVNLLRELHSSGDDARLFIFSGSCKKEWLEQIPWVKEVGNPSQARLLRLCTYVWEAWKLLRKWKPDAVVCTHPSTLRLARFIRSVFRWKYVPVVLWLHVPLSVQNGINEALTAADGHICICRERANEVRSALPHGSKMPVHVVYNGTSVGREYSVDSPAIPTFVYIGRLFVGGEKRVGDVLAAAALLRGEYRLKIVGDGPPDEVRKLHEMADQPGIRDKVEWLGWQKEPWQVISQATALVLASSYEGFSMVTVEALALGLTVIGSKSGGIAEEVLTPGKTGWTFPVGDIEQLASIMQAIVDQTIELPRSESVKEIGAKFSTENMAAAFRAAIEATHLSLL